MKFPDFVNDMPVGFLDFQRRPPRLSLLHVFVWGIMVDRTGRIYHSRALLTHPLWGVHQRG